MYLQLSETVLTFGRPDCNIGVFSGYLSFLERGMSVLQININEYSIIEGSFYAY